jgi:hypothetical protein
MPLRDAWVQTRALVKGVAGIATKLNTAGFHYKAHSSSRTWRLDHGWYSGIPRTSRTSRRTRITPCGSSHDPTNQWLRREAISNLGIMQALGIRPRMTRRVLTPGRHRGKATRLPPVIRVSTARR